MSGGSDGLGWGGGLGGRGRLLAGLVTTGGDVGRLSVHATLLPCLLMPSQNSTRTHLNPHPFIASPPFPPFPHTSHTHLSHRTSRWEAQARTTGTATPRYPTTCSSARVRQCWATSGSARARRLLQAAWCSRRWRLTPWWRGHQPRQWGTSQVCPRWRWWAFRLRVLRVVT